METSALVLSIRKSRRKNFGHLVVCEALGLGLNLQGAELLLLDQIGCICSDWLQR
jgi:hypothetical protein